jgi:hypothetical protein
MHFIIYPAGSKLPPTSWSTEATNTKETGPHLLLCDHEYPWWWRGYTGYLNKCHGGKGNNLKVHTRNAGKESQICFPRDMEHDGRMSLKVKKQLNYARQDWKEHWESLLAPCVRAALHEKRNSMVPNVMRAALLHKFCRRSQTCFLCITIAILLALPLMCWA